MLDCKNCEFHGYSEDLCNLHRRGPQGRRAKGKCASKHEKKHKAALVRTTTHWGMKTLVGAGAGVLAFTAGAAAAPILGGAVLAHAVAFQVSAGFLGTGIGFCGYRAKDNRILGGKGESRRDV